jgi:hypothetical protein
MAYAQGNKHDVFVSYARSDNQPIREDHGWVSFFKEKLEQLVNEELGGLGEADIFIDYDGVAPNEPVEESILEALRGSAIILALISPGYFQSEWCEREIRDFRKRMEDEAGPDNRIFFLKLRNFSYEDHEELFPNKIGYNFFGENGAIKQDSDSDAFWDELFRLRMDVVKVLKSLGEPEPVDDDRPTVFLADCAERDELAVFIDSLGYRVVSDHPEEAKLAIQIVDPENWTDHDRDQQQLIEKLPKDRILRAAIRESASQPSPDLSEIGQIDFLRKSELQAQIKTRLKSKKTFAKADNASSDRHICLYTQDLGSPQTAMAFRERLEPHKDRIRDLILDDELIELRPPDLKLAGIVVVVDGKTEPAWPVRAAFYSRGISPPVPVCAFFLDPGALEEQLLAKPEPFVAIHSDNGTEGFDAFIESVLNAPAAP